MTLFDIPIIFDNKKKYESKINNININKNYRNKKQKNDIIHK